MISEIGSNDCTGSQSKITLIFKNLINSEETTPALYHYISDGKIRLKPLITKLFY